MSYILDALQRADAERGRGNVPGLHARQLPTALEEAATARTGLRGPLVWGGLLVLVLAATVAGLWMWRSPASPSAPVAMATASQPAPACCRASRASRASRAGCAGCQPRCADRTDRHAARRAGPIRTGLCGRTVRTFRHRASCRRGPHRTTACGDRTTRCVGHSSYPRCGTCQRHTRSPSGHGSRINQPRRRQCRARRGSAAERPARRLAPPDSGPGHHRRGACRQPGPAPAGGQQPGADAGRPARPRSGAGDHRQPPLGVPLPGHAVSGGQPVNG